MLDTRRRIRKLVDKSFKESLNESFVKFFLGLVFALIIAFVPTYTGLSSKGVLTIFILVFAASLWVSEAIPAFATSLVVIALNIVLLGFTDFNFADKTSNWELYLKPWSNPLVFLFFAGFIMAAAASKTKLDFWLAKKVLFVVGTKPKNVLTAVLGLTFVFSMFVSNTATAAMMLTIVAPIIAKGTDKQFAKAILLAVVIGANLGGMGTIIGTPPNAIAIGLLDQNAPDFLTWMFYGVVPSFVLAMLLRFYVLKMYPTTQEKISLKSVAKISHFDDSTTDFAKIPSIPSWKKTVVVITFLFTVLLWLTSSLHNIPTTVVSLIPVVSFTMFKILDVDDIRDLRWDVIILIVGGLSLGIAVSTSGLALYVARSINIGAAGLLVLILVFSFLVVAISNFMSHTAASNIILPLVIAFGASFGTLGSTYAVVAVALSSSFAMCLPISTPPNAIIFSTGHLDTKDLLRLGLISGLLGPLIVAGWFYIIA